jgi:hypothetical protein
MRNLTVIALVAAGALAFAPSAFAEILHFTAHLDGAQETPPNDSPGTGMAEVTFDTATNKLGWQIVYSGLTGPAGAAHFHGPAEPGVAAGVVVKLGPGLDSPITGMAVITPEQQNWLTKGLMYVNIHTAAHPAGEIRGQVEPAH